MPGLYKPRNAEKSKVLFWFLSLSLAGETSPRSRQLHRHVRCYQGAKYRLQGDPRWMRGSHRTLSGVRGRVGRAGLEPVLEQE